MPFCKGVDVIRKGHRHNRSSKNFVEAVLHLKDNLGNFTRKRNRKSKTPAELAGISLDLGRNTTLGLSYV